MKFKYLVLIILCMLSINLFSGEFDENFIYAENYDITIKKEFEIFSKYYNILFKALNDNEIERSKVVINNYLQYFNNNFDEMDSELLLYVKNRFIAYCLLILAILEFENDPISSIELLYLGRHYLNFIHTESKDLYKITPPEYIYNHAMLQILEQNSVEDFKNDLKLKQYDKSFFYLRKKNSYSFIKEDFNKITNNDYYFILIYDFEKPMEELFLTNYKNLDYLSPLENTIEIMYNPKHTELKEYVCNLIKNTNLDLTVKATHNLGSLLFHIVGNEDTVVELKKKYIFNEEI